MSTVTTTSGETFTTEDSAALAYLIYRRWGNDITAAAVAWRRLFQNNCSDRDFARLVGTASLRSGK